MAFQYTDMTLFISGGLWRGKGCIYEEGEGGRRRGELFVVGGYICMLKKTPLNKFGLPVYINESKRWRVGLALG